MSRPLYDPQLWGPPVHTAGVLGIPIIESPILKYDEMMISYTQHAILVGETAHFKYRLRQIALNDECRKAAMKNIEATASRLLGEEWKVSPC